MNKKAIFLFLVLPLAVSSAWAKRAAVKASFSDLSLQPAVVKPGEGETITVTLANGSKTDWTPGTYSASVLMTQNGKKLNQTAPIAIQKPIPAGESKPLHMIVYVPSTASGKLSFRVLLIKDGRTLLKSEPVLVSIAQALPPPAAAASRPATVKALAGAAVIPNDVKISLPRALTALGLSWVIVPHKDKPEVAKKLVYTRFEADNKGQPWFSMKEKFLLNPPNRIILKAHDSFEDYALVDGIGAVVVSPKALGLLQARPGAKDLSFQRIVPLPYQSFRVFAGTGANLYLLGRNPKDKKSELYWLPVVNAAGKKTLSPQVLLNVPQKIAAVAGDGGRTFAATQSETYEIVGKKPVLLFRHPTEKITELAFSPAAGLFYATPTSVGFLSSKGYVTLIRAKNPSIRVKGNALFVYFPAHRAVLALGGISEFRKLSPAGL